MANGILNILGSPAISGLRQGVSQNVQEFMQATQRLQEQQDAIERRKLQEAQQVDQSLQRGLAVFNALDKAGADDATKQRAWRTHVSPHIDDVDKGITDVNQLRQITKILEQRQQLGPENAYEAIRAINPITGEEEITQPQDVLQGLPEELMRPAPEEAVTFPSFAERRGQKAASKPFQPITLVNPQTGEKIPYIPTYDPGTQTASLKRADLPPGFVLSTETPEERRQLDVMAARQKEIEKETGKGVAKRQTSTIEKGIDAAEGLVNLREARNLLDTVKTGGINAASLRAKQFFGIESANEAELSNKLSKAVLSQLKATFGAAFTLEEGKRLERIEAGFGKSTEGNKRLLDRSITIAERAARRGLKAAKDAGDEFAVQQIEDFLSSKGLGEIEEQQPAQSQTAGQIEFLGFE